MGVNPMRGRGGNKRPITRVDILRAMEHANGFAPGSRYLNVHIETFKKYAKLYGLYDQCKYKPGKGTQVRTSINQGVPLPDIFAGKHPNYNKHRLKYRLLKNGLLKNECAMCGFKEKRVLDGRVPLTMMCRDGNPHNLSLDNLELRCYNCGFLTSGEVRWSEETAERPRYFQQDMLEISQMTKDELEKIRSRINMEILDEEENSEV
jgi:hypothetical protein